MPTWRVALLRHGGREGGELGGRSGRRAHDGGQGGESAGGRGETSQTQHIFNTNVELRLYKNQGYKARPLKHIFTKKLAFIKLKIYSLYNNKLNNFKNVLNNHLNHLQGCHSFGIFFFQNISRTYQELFKNILNQLRTLNFWYYGSWLVCKFLRQ